MQSEAKSRPPLMRTAPDDFDTIVRRHTPGLMHGVLLCWRCDEIWPCDSRQLLDRLGVPRPPFTDEIGRAHV